MGVFSSIYRYIVTLGGLIGSGIDNRTDTMLTTPAGVKATYEITREKWTEQYNEVREAVAQLMMVIEQKRRKVDALNSEAEDVKVKLKGAVTQFKSTNDEKYKNAFNELFNRDKAITAEQAQLDTEINDLHTKVEAYKDKLSEMHKRVSDLKKEEAAAIADIVSSQQVIKLNDRLNSISTDLDDRNIQAVSDRRERLKAQAKLSGELFETLSDSDLDKELMKVGMKSEAADVFAAMLAEEEKTAPATREASVGERKREL